MKARYLESDGTRVLADARLTPVCGEGWLDIERPGLLLRLVFTLAEIDEMIDVLSQLRAQISQIGEGPQPQAECCLLSAPYP